MRAAALMVLLVACSSSTSDRVTHRLDPFGISLDLGAREVGGRAGAGYLFTSDDATSTVAITSLPGARASERSIHDMLPGATADVAWTRPFSFDGMEGTETRAVETFPHDRVHWIGVVDAPSGGVLVDLATDAAHVATPTAGDDAWIVLRGSIHRAR
jgi:hypothetical protein